MLLNLGLTADAAAAHPADTNTQTDSPSSPASASNYAAPFSLPALPFLGHLYNRTRPTDDPAQPPGTISGVAMSPVASQPSEGNSSNAVPSALARPRSSNPHTTRKSSRPKTLYQLAHPPAHARHKRLKLRPKLLLQLQQVSHSPRPLPILDVVPSTLYLPRLARKFPAILRGRNGLGPNDLIIVMSELYERSVATIPETQPHPKDEDEDHREVVATICQMPQEEARLKGKAEICLNFGPMWEATPLPSGSYEFVARTEDGVRVMRWALRGGKSHRTSVPPGAQVPQDTKRFTFSVIDPTTRRHPVIASLTRNQLEVHDEYAAVARASNGTTTPSSGMSVVSDMSDESTDANRITLDDGLRTLIIVTAIWVAFREGWSNIFNYSDPISSPSARSLVSPASSKHNSPVKGEVSATVERDDPTPTHNTPNGGKRCLSISSVRRANTTSPTDGEDRSFGSLSKRSNSTGAAFMDRVKRRSASGFSSRLGRHSMLAAGEQSREIVVPRPSSRQNSIGFESLTQHADQSKRKNKTETETGNGNVKVMPEQDGAPNSSANRHHSQETLSSKAHTEASDGTSARAAKGKRRQRFSALFTIFQRKLGVH